jgi:valyl-tRNA synthetase
MNQYNPQETEKEIRDFWKKEQIFKFDPKRGKTLYSIDTPPPTVSGKMHLGHALSYSQQDFIARYQRMKGNVLYPFGTDDNGLPTERLIEKLKHVKSKTMQRNEFIKLCLATLKEITPDFVQDWKNLGISCDYDLYYSTIDDNARKISQKSFLELYKKKLVYKKSFPTLWCPECQTAIAQAELEDKEQETFFSTIRFSVAGKELLIATTRPELLGACRAIFINPHDQRYKSLVGKKAKVPLFDHEVPIIADESAQMDKGTGALMICSYGDKYDVEGIKKHKLSSDIIISRDGKIIRREYHGLKIKEARKKIIEDLESQNLLKEKKSIIHVVNVHDKCGTEIEFLPTEQWFIKILDEKKKFIAAGKKINWHPKHMFKRYEHWIRGLEWDWSISRERHFGIPIPVWECSTCKEIILAEEKELPTDPLETKKFCKTCKQEAQGEEKVLDTWATSSLTPMIINSLVGNKLKLPLSLRPQAHDIIRTWAFYTIVKSLYHENKIPWKDIVISGFATLKGEKMSKSKGIIIEPQAILTQYGADAIRFWAAGPNLGEDLDYQEKDLITGKKLLNKLWNATNFVFMNLQEYQGEKPKKLELLDQLFLTKLHAVIDTCTKYFDEYEYAKAKQEVEKFFWSMFCDNYLEIVKKRVYKGIGNKKISAQYTLHHSLFTLVQLFAPFLPFITEHIYQTHFRKQYKEKSIHLTHWPQADKKMKIKTDALDMLLDIITKIRAEKSNNKKPMNAEIILTLDKKEFQTLKELQEDVKAVSNAKEIHEGKEFRVEII